MSVFFNKYIIAYNKVIDVNGEKELLPRFHPMRITRNGL